MEKRVNRLVSAYNGDGCVLTISCALKYDMVTVWRKANNYDDPTDVTYEISWWSGRSSSASEVREFAEALLEADKFIHSVKTHKVYVVEWEQDGERCWQGVLAGNPFAARTVLEQIVANIRSENPDIDHELSFEVALRVGEWSELGG